MLEGVISCDITLKFENPITVLDYKGSKNQTSINVANSKLNKNIVSLIVFLFQSILFIKVINITIFAYYWLVVQQTRPIMTELFLSMVMERNGRVKTLLVLQVWHLKR